MHVFLRRLMSLVVVEVPVDELGGRIRTSNCWLLVGVDIL